MPPQIRPPRSRLRQPLTLSAKRAPHPTAPQPSTSSQTGATNSAPARRFRRSRNCGRVQRRPLLSRLRVAQPAAGTPNGQAAGAAEPWTPPADKAAEAAALVDPLKLPEVAKMPDVVGGPPGHDPPSGPADSAAASIHETSFRKSRMTTSPTGSSNTDLTSCLPVRLRLT